MTTTLGESGSATLQRMEIPECETCGLPHVTRWMTQACKAHKANTNGEPCTKDRLKGQEVCRTHGGASGKLGALRKMAFAQTEGEVAELLRECDMPDQHPIDGLLEVVQHCGGMMRLLGSLVASLDLEPDTQIIAVGDGAKIGGDIGLQKVSLNRALTGYSHTGDGAPDVLVTLYGVWSDRYARACKLALDANIDERLVRSAESTSSAFFKAFEKALSKADLSPEQAAAFARSMADELRIAVGPSARELTG